MNRFTQRIGNFAWALWFGGMIALLIFVQVLFHTDRDIAIAAAPHLFHAFEAYQLGLAAIAIATAIPLWLRFRSRIAMAFLVMLIVASALSIVSTTLVTPEIMRLRAAGETHGPHFGMVHGISMLIYTTGSLALLIAGMAMPTNSAKDAKP